MVNTVKIFLSYSIKDSDQFKISVIAHRLEKKPEITDVLYCERDAKENWVEYMNKNVPLADVFIVFCSPTSLGSKFVTDEWMMAYQLKKLIIPVFVSAEDVPPLLGAINGYKFNIFKNILEVTDEIHDLILDRAKVEKQTPKKETVPMSETNLKILLTLIQNLRGVNSVALISREGLVVSSVFPSDTNPMHMAAMGAIMLSTNERVALETKIGEVKISFTGCTEGVYMYLDCGPDYIMNILYDQPKNLPTILQKDLGIIEHVRDVILASLDDE